MRQALIDEAENVRKAGRKLGRSLLSSPAGKVFERIVLGCLDALANLIKNRR